MSLNTSAGQASDLQRRGNWEAPLSAPAFTGNTVKRRSKGMRRLIRIGWNLLPPLTFVAIVGAVVGGDPRSSRFPPTCCPGRARSSRGSSPMRRCSGPTRVVTLTEIVLGFAPDGRDGDPARASSSRCRRSRSRSSIRRSC